MPTAQLPETCPYTSSCAPAENSRRTGRAGLIAGIGQYTGCHAGHTYLDGAITFTPGGTAIVGPIPTGQTKPSNPRRCPTSWLHCWLTQPRSGFTVRRLLHQLHASDLGGYALSDFASGLLFRNGCATFRFSGRENAQRGDDDRA